MCKFTYLGYGGCEEPERHYFVRREKCVTKAHLKHWCDPHEQEEAVLTAEDELVDMACPMCADVPVIYDQPLLDLAHSRRCVLPAPRYDGVTGQYSGLPRHLVYNSRMNRPHVPPKNSSETLVPRPLNMARMIHQRSASETAVNRIRQRAVTPDYTLATIRYDEAQEHQQQQQQEQEMLMLPSATYMPGEEQIPMLPATAYMPPPQDSSNQLPKPLPTPQPMELTPPSSREGSMSPPQNRMGMVMRIPPGESSRRELESIRERARLAAANNNNSNNKQQQQRRPGTDRSRSGSESSTSSFGTPNPPPPPPPPRRKASTASSEASAASSSVASSRNGGSVASSRSTSRSAVRRPEHHRKESSASAISAASSSSRTPPQPQQQSESGTDRFTAAALRTIGISMDRTDSPDRGRGRQRRERGGSSSERSDSPSIWRPTISPPQLQQDSLGMGSSSSSSSNSSTTNIVEPLKQRLVPFRPTKSGATTPNSIMTTVTTPRRETSVTMLDLQRPPKTPHPNAFSLSSQRSPAAPLRLYPSKEDDAKIASAAFNTMLQEEQKAMSKSTQFHSEQQQQQQSQNNNEDEELESAIEMNLPTVSMQFNAASSNNDPYGSAGVGRAAAGTTAPKAGGLPAAARAGLRRIKTGQVKTVTIASPLRPLKRSNTEDVLTTPVSATMKVRGGPLFSIAGVAGGRTQEFEIVHKHGEGESLGKVF